MKGFDILKIIDGERGLYKLDFELYFLKIKNETVEMQLSINERDTITSVLTNKGRVRSKVVIHHILKQCKINI